MSASHNPPQVCRPHFHAPLHPWLSEPKALASSSPWGSPFACPTEPASHHQDKHSGGGSLSGGGGGVGLGSVGLGGGGGGGNNVGLGGLGGGGGVNGHLQSHHQTTSSSNQHHFSFPPTPPKDSTPDSVQTGAEYQVIGI